MFSLIFFVTRSVLSSDLFPMCESALSWGTVAQHGSPTAAYLTPEIEKL